ncbi:hypothetical protein F5Y03DRAFT_398536 [Xylaria venustula]|nr:hypothetical protein F5Y03DRAFT_398536 [Xylaria venustula]
MAEVATTKLNDYDLGVVRECPFGIGSEHAGSLPTTESYSISDGDPKVQDSVPIAVCGMATRLPGGISSPEQLWEFILNKGDACIPIPGERYTTHLPRGDTVMDDRDGAAAGDTNMRHWKTHGYMLDHVDLAAFDSALFSMSRTELSVMDPQQRILLELTRECFESAGETFWRGKPIGVFVGTFGEDWNDVQYHDRHDLSLYKLPGAGDYILANRISYEYDLKGPSVVSRTACSAASYSLHLACQALQSGDISGALVGGCNLIMNPSKVETMFNVGILSKDATSRSFDADANGYARGEAVTVIYVKRLDDALRDGNPVRAIIRSSSTNCDGKTAGLTKPSTDAHEAVIRASYAAAGLESELHKTGFFECHATGTSTGDPVEARAVANIFGSKGGVYIGSVKPNLGHSEGASGLTSLLKCIMALENRTIPPNINFQRPNPDIPFNHGGLRVPTNAIPWPKDRVERASINSFGVGGANTHIIVDSAASFGIKPIDKANAEGNRLLVFTANSAESAERGAQECGCFIADHYNELDNIAYTLGVRREHLPYRAFAIVNSAKTSKDIIFSAPVKTLPLVSSIVFIFTGQGAQWPTMGAALLSEYTTAMGDIRTMESALLALGNDLAPDWSLLEELLRCKDSTQVYKAEFSHPLCAAVQIMVVNLLRSWGIIPTAVLGHSGGEIAAAYACGALTMQQAIICSYLRGRATKHLTGTPGAMAAVGLGSADIEPYLIDGVGIACENSPFNTTLSGDEEKIVKVIQAIKYDRPDVFARRLQVDVAYHSRHMKKIGLNYEWHLAAHIRAKPPSVPFFSTVTGRQVVGDSLDAAYWRSNLESPVLFNTGVQELLRCQGMDSILVEIGPHSALSGPLRHIFNHLKSEQSLYLPTLLRSKNDSIALLNTAGQLFCRGFQLRFDCVNPSGRVLPNLPSYPWNHDTRYWYESRISRDYRGRRFPHHPLVGSRVVETSQLEPIWRNILRLDRVPWCRDHKIDNDVVFPATGYLAMAAEGIRQLSGAQDVTLRRITIASALIFGQESTEIILSMRPHKLTNSLDSPWYEFSISSYEQTSDSWAKHCFGLVRAGGDTPKHKQSVAHLPREVEPGYWYKAMRRVGLNYGPQFQGLSRISTHFNDNMAVADVNIDLIPEPEPQDAAVYFFHPASSDVCMQLFSAAAARGHSRLLRRKAVPTYIGEAYFKNPQGLVTVEAKAHTLPIGTIIGTCAGFDATKTMVIQLRDVKLTPIDGEANSVEDTHAGARLLWKPDVDLQDVSQLIHCQRKIREDYPRLQSILLLCCMSIQNEFDVKQVQISSTKPHLISYQEWISKHIEQAQKEGYLLLDEAEVCELFQLSPELRPARIEQYLKLIIDPRHVRIGELMCRVYESFEGIIRGQVDSLDILRQDDALAAIYSIGNEWDYGSWLRLLSHRSPRLRVLEIGAGTGASTEIVLRGLDAFYSYAYTDVSAGFFPAAKERFSHVGPRMQFRTLDITLDPLEQGFEPSSFDLIIAANVLHATPKLGATLANVRKLLSPGGKLLLQEMCMTVKWINFTLGHLPGWWLGETDERHREPYVSPERWANELQAAGFSAPEASVVDDEMPFQVNATIVASLDTKWKLEPAVYLLSRQPEGEIAQKFLNSFRKFGLEIETIGLSEKPKGFVISILDLEGPSILHSISANMYYRIKTFLAELVPQGLLWLTTSSQIHCLDPQHSGILGLLRVLRNESGTSLCTLELDEATSPKAWEAVLQVYKKICRTRSEERDALIDPDHEFAYSDGTIYLPRFRWFSVSDELAVQEKGQCSYKRLEIGQRGSLKSLRWAERPLRDDLAGEDVYVDIRAVGMNFKDTLIAMGIVNGPEEAGDGFGIECSGVVRAVGPDVKDLAIGDRVMAITQDAYATTTRTIAALCIKIPNDMSFETAASIPCVYLTVIHGLINLARLEKGQTVLVHSACGGVGLAAIHICQMLGVDTGKIYASVGSSEKVQYLINTFGLPRSHIFSSRDTNFVSGIMRKTEGRGIDVVLNSLSGELLHASWKCVAEFGSMVEIGKRDFVGQGRLELEPFEDNRAFFGVEMSYLIAKQPHRARQLGEQFMEYYRSGALKPAQPIRVFDAADIQSAIRTMQKGQHIGKLVVRIPEDYSKLAASPARQSFNLRADASYLLVGGLGGIGRSITMWMVEHGAKHFIFISRSGGKKSCEVALIRALEGSGCTASVVTGSVTEVDTVVRAVDQAPAPIAGVVQLFMVLRDQLFAEMPFEEWEAVTGPKIQGTWNLHTALAQQPLDFFVLFSSHAGLVGQHGQANYASASTFLDAFVQFRHALGLAASVLDLGVVGDIGFVAESPDVMQFFKTNAHYVLAEQNVLDSFELAIRKSAPTVRESPDFFTSDSQIALGMRSTMPLSSPHNRNTWRRDARLGFYHILEAEAGWAGSKTEETESSGNHDEDVQIRRLVAMAEADLSIVTQDSFVAELARCIGMAFFNFLMKPVKELDVAAPLGTLGIDSLIGIEVRNWLRLRLNIEMSLLEIMRSENMLALAKLGAQKWASKSRTNQDGSRR